LAGVSVVEREGNRVTLRVEGYSVALVNAVRRVILSDVPVMAVDFAYIYDNNTPIYDEMISHRLGLVVLSSEDAIERYRPPEECKGREPGEEGAEDCYVRVDLQVEVPEDGSGRYVTAGELEISDPNVKPVYPETPIAYVGPGQRIHLVAYARLGRGREHGRWSPASLAALRYTPVVEIVGEASRECIECLEAYPQVVEALEKGVRGELRLEGLKRTSGLKYCSEGPCKDALKVRYDPGVLFLEVETTGALSPERTLREAVNILEEKIKRFREAVRSAGIQEEEAVRP